MLNSGYSYQTPIQRGGESVLDFLCREYTHSAREIWAARLAAGEVEVDGRRVSGTEPLKAGQLLVWHRPPWHEEKVPLDYAVVYEDADLLAVNKPGGLPTMPGGGFLEHTLLMQVRRHWPTASPLHRLGRGTSGLVLFALNAEAGAALLRDWREHRIAKIYRALSAGIAPQNEYDIRTPIGPVPHAKLGTVYAASPGGKPAHSLAQVRQRHPENTDFEVQIFTGRPHQIRIHLASVGYPLVGDPLYMAGGNPRPDALPGDLGYCLHAQRLSFKHPRTGQLLTLNALSESFPEL